MTFTAEARHPAFPEYAMAYMSSKEQVGQSPDWWWWCAWTGGREGRVRCGAVRCGAVRCGAVRCGAVRCGVEGKREEEGGVRSTDVRRCS